MTFGKDGLVCYGVTASDNMIAVELGLRRAEGPFHNEWPFIYEREMIKL